MRIETKVIKEILKLYYPNNKFKVKYIPTNNYVDSSDRILITIINGNNELQEQVISAIKNYVYGIKVYKYGEIVSIGYNHGFHAKIMIPNSNQYIIPDSLEFIEVKIAEEL